MSRATYDPDAKALYVYLKENEERAVKWSGRLSEGVNVDYDADGSLIGVEVLGVEIITRIVDADPLCGQDTRHSQSHVTSLCRLPQGHEGACEA